MDGLDGTVDKIGLGVREQLIVKDRLVAHLPISEDIRTRVIDGVLGQSWETDFDYAALNQQSFFDVSTLFNYNAVARFAQINARLEVLVQVGDEVLVAAQVIHQVLADIAVHVVGDYLHAYELRHAFAVLAAENTWHPLRLNCFDLINGQNIVKLGLFEWALAVARPVILQVHVDLNKLMRRQTLLTGEADALK